MTRSEEQTSQTTIMFIFYSVSNNTLVNLFCYVYSCQQFLMYSVYISDRKSDFQETDEIELRH